MIRGLLVCVMLSFVVQLRAQVWQENFNTYTAGTTSHAATPAWTTIQPTGNPGGTKKFSTQVPATGYNVFEVDDTGIGSEGTWTSEVVDISSFTEVALEITLYSYFTFSTDYIRCYYKRSGGPEIMIGELTGNSGLNIASAASAIVTGGPGATVQIIVRGQENTLGQNSGVDRTLAFDDVTITNINVLYSITNGSWSNGLTWSTGGYGGAACNCTPTQDSRVIIGNNKTVTISSASATVAGVTVENTGILNWGGNQNITMARGGTINVNTGGKMDKLTFAASVVFNAYSYTIIVDGIMSTTSLIFNTGSDASISGTGTLTAGSFAVTNGNGRSISNAISGSLNITGDLDFAVTTADNSAFSNTGNATIGRIFFGGKNVALTNSGTLTSTATGVLVNSNTSDGNSITNTGTMTVSTINLTSADFTLSNSGTLNQTGNFSNVATGTGSSFSNLAGGSWTFSGTTITNVRLFASAATNTFTYGLSGAQTIITPQDSYSNLTLSGSGTKTASAALTIGGNFAISGTTFAAGTNAVNLAGNWTVTGGGSFTKGTETVSLNGTSNQTITNTAGESFYNLTINKTAGNVVLSSAVATNATVTNILTLTNGGLSINGNALDLTSSSVSAIGRTSGFIVSETTGTPYSRVVWSVGATSGTYVFPFGKTSAAADYVPFTFQTTTIGTGSGTVSVATYPTPTNNTPYPSGVLNVNTMSGDNSANVVDRFWIITVAGYSTNPVASMTFTTTAGETSGISTQRAQRWNSLTNLWDAPVSGQTNPTSASAKVTGVNTFSPWTLSGNNTVLPIGLTAFDAKPEANHVQLNWKTAEEINNDFFTVERSADGEVFSAVTTVPGKGTVYQPSDYKATDDNPLPGASYYRLRQTDFDGASTVSRIVSIFNDGPVIVKIIPYPNPFNGRDLTVNISGGSANQMVPLRIFNLFGIPVYEDQHFSTGKNGGPQKIELRSSLPSGMYLIQAGSMPPQKLIVE